MYDKIHYKKKKKKTQILNFESVAAASPLKKESPTDKN